MKEFKVKKVVDNNNEVVKLNKKETIKNIRKTPLGSEYSGKELHPLSDPEIIKVCKLCNAELINKKPSKKTKTRRIKNE